MFSRLFAALIPLGLEVADVLLDFWDHVLKIVYLLEVLSHLLILLAPNDPHERAQTHFFVAQLGNLPEESPPFVSLAIWVHIVLI